MGFRPRLALWLLCVATYLCFAPGRLLFPDDEIVFQTTRSMWERGDLAIDGIPKRTGEPKGRPDGTFGWAPGPDGLRYGFFGHGQSVVALPLYGLGRAASTGTPPAWRHVIRSDHMLMHKRGSAEDLPRLLASLTNCFITAFAALLLVEWLRALGHRDRVAMAVGLVYAFGTSAWPYSGMFLSEPLSAVMLLASAWGIARYHRDRAARPDRAAHHRWLWMAALVAGLSLHAHVLNLLAIPCLLGYAAIPSMRGRACRSERTAWVIAIALGLVGPLLLGLTQWMRFGDPWQTGRYDHYGYFIDPLPALAGQLVGPGRSILLYSPALLLALLGWRRAFTRQRAAAWLVLALFVVRWAFVSTRSDWWGGWGIGPRYLIPLLPLLLLPLAEVFSDLDRASRNRRVAAAVAVLGCVMVELHLALHSIFEWMWSLIATGTPQLDYLTRSHWFPSASPLVGFFEMPIDILSLQAWRLAEHGHPGPWRIYLVVMGIAVAAAAVLVHWWIRGRPRSDPA